MPSMIVTNTMFICARDSWKPPGASGAAEPGCVATAWLIRPLPEGFV